jgi:heme ABC exporter ATP-binding subunit CcmA
VTEPPLASPAVVTAALSRRFGARRALDGLDLSVQQGEFLTLFGPNGAGKSTLIKILARLVRPSAGTVQVFGIDLQGSNAATVQPRIGLMTHDSLLYHGLSGRENLLFYASMYGVEDRSARCDELLERLGLRDRGDDLIRTYSRGMQQRLSVARALVQDPDLLLLDEPFTGLDPSASELLCEILEHMRARGRTVLLTTHDLAVGHRLGSRCVILARGRLAFESSLDRISADDLEKIYRQHVEGR